MPGGDVSDLTLRRLKALQGETRRDRLAVAALYAGSFPSSRQALDALEELLAAPSPPGGRTRSDRHLTELDQDTRAWAQEIANPLAVLAAAEVVRAELESRDNDPGGDSSPATEPGAQTQTLQEQSEAWARSRGEWRCDDPWKYGCTNTVSGADPVCARCAKITDTVIGMTREQAEAAGAPSDWTPFDAKATMWVTLDGQLRTEARAAEPERLYEHPASEDDEVRPLADMPESIWLCPSDHMDEFYSPHGGTCPQCPRQLVEYTRGIDGWRSHLLHWVSLLESNLDPWPEVRRKHPYALRVTKAFLKPDGDRQCDTCGGPAWRMPHPHRGDSWYYQCARGHTTVVGK